MIEPDLDELLASIYRLEPGTDLPTGVRLFHRYHIWKLRGIGGTSIVLEGRDEILDRPVALKIWSHHLSSRYDRGANVHRYFEGEKDFFKREAQSLASVAHPALCRIYDFGLAENGIPWMALEFISGDTLRARLAHWRDNGGSPPFSDVLDLFHQIVDAVAFLHSSSLCQLDLKPENVLLADGRARLIDFASALERPGEGYQIKGARYGTPGYIAPELIIRKRAEDEQAATPASDVFSLGILLLEMLTLKNPLATEELQKAAYEALGIVESKIYRDYLTAAFWPDFSEELAAWADKYIQGLREIHLSDARWSSLAHAPRELVQLIQACLAEAPADRPANAEAVLAQLSVIRSLPSTLGPVFISHAHRDKDVFVGKFVDALIERQVAVWYDSYDLRVGEPFWDRIYRALEQARFVIAVLSKNMLQSANVSEELRYAHLENINRVKLLPILIDNTPLDSFPPSLRSRHILRFPEAAAGDEFFSSIDELVRQMRSLAVVQ